MFILVFFLFLCLSDHKRTPADTTNQHNLLRNVSNCIKSSNIKQDSRKRQQNTTDRENEASTSEEHVTGIY